jgi:hypothetical protein
MRGRHRRCWNVGVVHMPPRKPVVQGLCKGSGVPQILELKGLILWLIL